MEGVEIREREDTSRGHLARYSHASSLERPRYYSRPTQLQDGMRVHYYMLNITDF